jgi:hypothetical protein
VKRFTHAHVATASSPAQGTHAFVDEARPKGTPDDKVFGRVSDHSQLSEEVSGKIRQWLGVI